MNCFLGRSPISWLGFKQRFALCVRARFYIQSLRWCAVYTVVAELLFVWLKCMSWWLVGWLKMWWLHASIRSTSLTPDTIFNLTFSRSFPNLKPWFFCCPTTHEHTTQDLSLRLVCCFFFFGVLSIHPSTDFSWLVCVSVCASTSYTREYMIAKQIERIKRDSNTFAKFQIERKHMAETLQYSKQQ